MCVLMRNQQIEIILFMRQKIKFDIINVAVIYNEQMN
jgi:hypothetical protein